VQLASTERVADLRRPDECRADARLVTMAAECIARLDRVCGDWTRMRRLDLAFEVAFGKLRGEMAPAEWQALRGRYEEHRADFDVRLVAGAAVSA
jgi:hypothetical protein